MPQRDAKRYMIVMWFSTNNSVIEVLKRQFATAENAKNGAMLLPDRADLATSQRVEIALYCYV